MDPKVFNCRNFKCPSNKSGDCIATRLEMLPTGGLLDHLICVQAEEPDDIAIQARAVLPEPVDPARTGKEHHDVA